MRHVMLITLLSTSTVASASDLLKARTPITLPGAAGRFDSLTVDGADGRLLAAHKGTGGLALYDLAGAKVLPEVKTGEAQGVAVDAAGGRYFVGDEDEKKVVVVDAKTLKLSGEVSVPGPVDAVAYDPKNGMVYADEDNGSRVWVIDPKSMTVTATIMIPGEPEYLEYDPTTDRLYQNIKDKNQVVAINPATNKIEQTWSTLPATSPHGLAVDGKRGRLYIAGKGRLIALDEKTGKVVGDAPVVEGVDQIAFDAATDRVYCPGKGAMTVVKVTDQSLAAAGNVTTPKGAKTLAIDPKTHDVWIAYADQSHSYLQAFGP